jgi:hypothetical protein
MIASYGYEDGTGFYYITIDTDICAVCDTKKCVSACLELVFEVQENDWEEVVIAVNKDKTHVLQACCNDCRQDDAARRARPCQQSCSYDAISFSW